MKLMPRQSLTRTMIGTALIVTVLALAGCGPKPTQAPPTAVRVHLDWLHTVDAAQFYMAADKGYYEEENLDVTVLPSGYDADGNFIDPVEKVKTGQAEFGIIDAGYLLTAREQGLPLVAVAAIYQRSPVAFVSLDEKNIVRPQDLVDTTVQLTSYNEIVFEAMMISQGIDLSQVNVVERTDYTIAPLVDGEADVIDAWVTNEVADLVLQDHEVNMVLPSDYGVVMYPNIIFCTEDTLANNPDLVERFVRATVRGMKSAIDDPQKSAELAVSHDPEHLNLEQQVESMRQSLPLRNPAGSRPGMMYDKDWEATHQMLLDQGILSTSLDVNAAYTLVFLEKAYSN